MTFILSPLHMDLISLASIRRKPDGLMGMTQVSRTRPKNEAGIFQGIAAIPGDGMLLCSRTPRHSERGRPIRLRDHSATLGPVTANNFVHFHFKFVDFVLETISSAIEWFALSFRIISGIIDSIFTLHPTGHDNDRHHRGFGRHDLGNYFQLDTALDHFTARTPRPVAVETGRDRPPAMAAGPLVASYLAFPAGRDQLRPPCEALRRKRCRRAVRCEREGVCVP